MDHEPDPPQTIEALYWRLHGENQEVRAEIAEIRRHLDDVDHKRRTSDAAAQQLLEYVRQYPRPEDVRAAVRSDLRSRGWIAGAATVGSVLGATLATLVPELIRSVGG